MNWLEEIEADNAAHIEAPAYFLEGEGMEDPGEGDEGIDPPLEEVVVPPPENLHELEPAPKGNG